jgi:uncharacterized membrane protein
MNIYPYLIVLIIIIILFLLLNYILKKQNYESFSQNSDFSKDFILNDCSANFAKFFNKSLDDCLNSAWVKNPKYLCGICGENGNPLYSFRPNNDNTKPLLYGCSPNATNYIGLKWNQIQPVNQVNPYLSDIMTCNSSNKNATSNMYLYICADDKCVININGQVVKQNGWNTFGVHYFENIKFGDLMKIDITNMSGPGGFTLCYIWNKQLFILDNNGFENCANVINYQVTGKTGFSNSWDGSIPQLLPWMKNWITIANVIGTQPTYGSISFNIGDNMNVGSLTNDCVVFVGASDSCTVTLNGNNVYTSSNQNVNTFTIPNVNQNDVLNISCLKNNTRHSSSGIGTFFDNIGNTITGVFSKDIGNTITGIFNPNNNVNGDTGGVALTYLWCGRLFTLPSNLNGFNSTANIINYTSSSTNGMTYNGSGVSGNLHFMTNWLKGCTPTCKKNDLIPGFSLIETSITCEPNCSFSLTTNIGSV